MKHVLSIAGGVVLGFAAAHLVNATPRGRAFFESVNERLAGFREAVGEGYEARTEQLMRAIDETSRPS